MMQNGDGSAGTDSVFGGGALQPAADRVRTQDGTAPRKDGRSPAAICARVISTVLQPLLMPLYAMLIIINANSFVSVMLPLKGKVMLVLAVTLLTLILPGIMIGILNALGALEDFRMNNRKERIVPLAVIFVTYVFCAYMVFEWTGIDLVFMTLMAAVSCLALALVVTSFWKISMHMIGLGGIYAILFVLGIAEHRDFTWVMVAATILAGLLAASRLYLGRHTPMQVAAGFVGGFVVSMLTMMFI